MNTAGRSELLQVLQGRCDAIADKWYQAIARTSDVPHSAAEVRQHLVGLTEQVIALLLTNPLERGRAEAIGAALARLHCIEPEVVSRTQELLAQQLVQGLPADQVVALQPRLAALLGGLAAGFFQQAREAILAKQAQIREALISDLQRTEEALGKARDKVERRVQERTAELVAVNKRLRREIAERKRVEEALKESESRLGSVLSSMVDLVFAFDSEGRFIFHHSPRVGDLYIPPGAFVGRKHSDVMPAHLEKPFAEAFEKNKKGQVAEYQYWLEIGDEVRWFSAKLSPVFLEGKFTGSVAVAREITERKRMEEALQNAHEELVRRVERRTAELAMANEQLRRLARQIVSAQEEERQRLSRALHDEAGQALTALRISLELIQDDLPVEFDLLRQRIGDAAALTDATMEQIRLLARDLRPPALDAVGLNPTLEAFCRDFAKRTQLPIDYLGLGLPMLPEAVNMCLYRFLQEALTNVAKHACANQVCVALRYDAETVSLSVEDDGRGFDKQARLSVSGWPMGIGLLGMQERLESLGGRLEIESQPGQGTRLVAHLPAGGTP